MRRFWASAGALALLLAVPASAVTVTHVRHAPAFFEPGAGGTVWVLFRLSAPARVVVRLWDARDRLVGEITPDRRLPAGDHRLRWDGRDAAGRIVPPEAYRYTIEATPPGGETVVHDWTDLASRRPFEPEDLRWDREDAQVRYSLPHRGRVRIRVWLGHGGPLLATVLDWAPRPEGENAESWTARGLAAVPASLASRIELRAHAFPLSPNEIGVLPHASQPRWITDFPWEDARRERRSEPPNRQRDPVHQPAAARGDYAIRLRVPGAEDGGPGGPMEIPAGIVPVRIEVADQDAPRLWAERFGVELYVDGELRRKNELGYLPLTWRWDASGLSGEHLLTANVFGYDGNMGAASLRVHVRNGPR